jgi:hypothetical protein
MPVMMRIPAAAIRVVTKIGKEGRMRRKRICSVETGKYQEEKRSEAGPRKR